MEQGGATSRYWCHMCSRTVNPTMEVEVMKCPICDSGFVEEMASAAPPAAAANDDVGGIGASESDRALSLWAPILLGMMASPIRHRSLRQTEEPDNDHDNNGGDEEEEEEEEAESLMRRRRRRRSSAAAILQLLQSLRAGMVLEENHHHQEREREREREGGGGGVIFINPFNQTILLQGQGQGGPASLGDYFIGPGLDLLLQHLTENDPNRYGTPPAQKEAVDALPTVVVEEEAMQCAVCLDECEVGSQVKEMPCKHKFHSTCIVPWLQLHSSCPVCRYQLPADESKHASEASSRSSSASTAAANGGDDGRNDNGRPFSVPLLWPFTALFSSSTSQPSSAGSPALTYPSGSSTDAPPTTSNADDN